MSMQFTLVSTEDGSQNLTVYFQGKAPQVAHSTHPNFEKILEGVRTGDESVADLFDVAQTVGEKFSRLTERVTVHNGRIFLDGDEMDNTIAHQAVRFMNEGVEDWKPLVAFMENVAQNESEHSREQLYDWLQTDDFTITQDGMIVGYKGVRKNDDGSFTSINTGTATVDGEVYEGAIPNHIGAVVEMPRSQVEFDPSIGCHQGLHVGTYDYANNFAWGVRGALLVVYVNPRDVVSVPTDCDAQKMRVCRYTVVNTIDKPYEESVLFDDSSEDYDEYYDEYYEGEDDADYNYDEAMTQEDWDNYNRGAEELMELLAKLETPYQPPRQTTVEVGDLFRDLDKRRPRLLEVTNVADDGEVFYTTDAGYQGRIQVDRLLTPYRFEKLPYRYDKPRLRVTS
jgi:hypothetical protein